ncbi:MAG: site-specific integrase [Candidatus Sedimenticola sp. (ex Thyasira tokunagai)]
MMNGLATKHIVSGGGERLKLLVVSSSGLPLFYPNLYITSQIRGGAKSVATIQSFITSMKVLYSWSVEYSIDIEDRWMSGEWLEIWEIDSLRDHCSLALRSSPVNSKKVVNLKQGHGGIAKSVDSATKYVRMTFVADYLKWLAEVMGARKSDKARKAEVDAMYKSIKAHRPKKKGRSDTAREDKGLDPELLLEVLEISKPGHEKNPYGGYPLQARNASIIALLHYLGIRRGELLNLRVDDIDFVANEIRIIRRADSSLDQRIYQPLVKTQERVLPINDRLAEKLGEYVTKIRSKFPRARKHPYLFVTHKNGPYQGSPLSNSGFGKLMSALRGVADSFSQVHAHAFRHSWNYSFSKVLDKSDSDQSPEKEEQMRSYLMGWKETSGTAAIYNRRHTKEKARESVLDFQKNVGRIGSSSDE